MSFNESAPNISDLPSGVRKAVICWSRNQLVHNIAALYGMHVARYLLPLVVVPYLARVLTPSGWGKVAFAQGFSAYLMLVVEYGFNLSATREVARLRGDREKVAAILAGVTGAKFLLAALCVLAGWTAVRWVPLFRNDQALLWAAIFAGATGIVAFLIIIPLGRGQNAVAAVVEAG